MFKSMSKGILLLVLLVAFHGVEAEPYVSIGVGYKLSESIGNICSWKSSPTPKYCAGMKSHPLTARLEIGYEWKNVRAGITHHSQWLQGWPVNSNKDEYSKNEVFVDYVFRFK